MTGTEDVQRRTTISERMAKFGGIKFGAPPPVNPCNPLAQLSPRKMRALKGADCSRLGSRDWFLRKKRARRMNRLADSALVTTGYPDAQTSPRTPRRYCPPSQTPAKIRGVWTHSVSWAQNPYAQPPRFNRARALFPSQISSVLFSFINHQNLSFRVSCPPVPPAPDLSYFVSFQINLP